MKKQLLASLLSVLFAAGLATAQTTTTTAAPATTLCQGTKDCPMDKGPNCPLHVLTKEECKRFCTAKAAAIKANPSLAKPENKCALCRAIVKADPSMSPICMKLKKNCHPKQHCTQEQNNCTSKSPDTASSGTATFQSSMSAAPSDASTSQSSAAVSQDSASASH